MTNLLELRYTPEVIKARETVHRNGSFRDKVRFDLIDRPPYACGLLMAADMARFSGLSRITAIEFGVAEGNGLLNLCQLTAEVTKETGVQFDVLGFDTGTGLPELQGYRDHPEIWSAGDFAGVDRIRLEKRLPANARVVWGDIRDTLNAAVSEITAPVGFMANDLDLYSSTMGSLELFDAASTTFLPVVISYFDDTLGSPTRIGSLFRNRWCGQLAAIRDFNHSHDLRKIDSLRTLKARRPMDRELWLDQMYGLHVLDHPQRQSDPQRTAMKINDHATDVGMNWPL